jgi:two-component system cell cycle response regulator
MNGMKESGKLEWHPAELRTFLLELMEAAYGHHEQQDLMLTSEETQSVHVAENKPLVLILDDDISLLMYLKERLESMGWIVVATRSTEKAISYFWHLTASSSIIFCRT